MLRKYTIRPFRLTDAMINATTHKLDLYEILGMVQFKMEH